MMRLPEKISVAADEFQNPPMPVTTFAP